MRISARKMGKEIGLYFCEMIVQIRGFSEKGRSGPGTINGGTYLLSPDLFNRYSFPPAFSFETDLLMPHVHEIRPLAFPAPGLFIDIGLPEDYHRAQNLFAPLKQE